VGNAGSVGDTAGDGPGGNVLDGPGGTVFDGRGDGVSVGPGTNVLDGEGGNVIDGPGGRVGSGGDILDGPGGGAPDVRGNGLAEGASGASVLSGGDSSIGGGDGSTHGGVMRSTAGCPGAEEGSGVACGVKSGIRPNGSGVGQICANPNQCCVKPLAMLAFTVLPKYEFPYLLASSCMNSHVVCCSCCV
jgi:hypothetical protein